MLNNHSAQSYYLRLPFHLWNCIVHSTRLLSVRSRLSIIICLLPGIFWFNVINRNIFGYEQIFTFRCCPKPLNTRTAYTIRKFILIEMKRSEQISDYLSEASYTHTIHRNISACPTKMHTQTHSTIIYTYCSLPVHSNFQPISLPPSSGPTAEWYSVNMIDNGLT